MSGSIYSRVNSLAASDHLLKNLRNIQKEMFKQQSIASSLKKVNKASDSPASYYMIRQYDKRISNLNTKQTVYEQSINFLQKNSGYLDQIATILADMSDLATQALDVTATTAEKIAIQEEINQLRESIEGTLSGIGSIKYTQGFLLAVYEMRASTARKPTALNRL
ncbi:MAG: hypothetical protein RBU23_11055 [Candidatus Auribacterota bacterium]|jgi:flagellin|nr:hypothetical protein [Candidatus Auribacterota bacterium]